MATFTPNIALAKPIVGGDEDVWGALWNTNADTLDTIVGSNYTQLAGHVADFNNPHRVTAAQTGAVSQAQADLRYLQLAGGTMLGMLRLFGPPVDPLDAATRQYVDSQIASGTFVDAPMDGSSYGRLNGTWAGVLPLTGGVLTGRLSINQAADIGNQLSFTGGGYDMLVIDQQTGVFRVFNAVNPTGRIFSIDMTVPNGTTSLPGGLVVNGSASFAADKWLLLGATGAGLLAGSNGDLYLNGSNEASMRYWAANKEWRWDMPAALAKPAPQDDEATTLPGDSVEPRAVVNAMALRANGTLILPELVSSRYMTVRNQGGVLAAEIAIDASNDTFRAWIVGGDARGFHIDLAACLPSAGTIIGPGGAGGEAPAPSNADPAMDGIAAPGTAVVYARGDHVHPSDTSRAPVNYPNFTTAIRVTGAPAADVQWFVTDAAIDEKNWDLYAAGNTMRMRMLNDGFSTGTDVFVATRSGYLGTGFDVYARTTIHSDLGVVRSDAPTTGALFFGNAATTYLYFDGINYVLNGASGLIVNGAVGVSASNLVTSGIVRAANGVFADASDSHGLWTDGTFNIHRWAADGWADKFNRQNGNRVWTNHIDENLMTLNAGGDLWAARQISAAWTITAGGDISSSGALRATTGVFAENTGDLGIYQSGTYRYLRWMGSWADSFDTTTGIRYWLNSAGSGLMSLSATGTLAVTGNITTANAVRALRLENDAGGGGRVLCLNGANTVAFDWTTSATVAYSVDNGVVWSHIVSGTNCKNLGFISGGGPTAVQLNGNDLTDNAWGIYVDIASDARIKTNIRNTEADVIGILHALPVRSFDVIGDVAAYMSTVGKSPEERAAAREAPTDAPVSIGFIAQEVLAAGISEAVSIAQGTQPDGSPLPDDMHTLIQQLLVPYLWRAAQIHDTRLDNLTAALAAAQGRITRLEVAT